LTRQNSALNHKQGVPIFCSNTPQPDKGVMDGQVSKQYALFVKIEPVTGDITKFYTKVDINKH